MLKLKFLLNLVAELAGDAGYTDCISAGVWDSPNDFPRYDTKQSDCEAQILLEILFVGFSLFWFYGISNFLGYLMPNPFYTYNSSISNNSI